MSGISSRWFECIVYPESCVYSDVDELCAYLNLFCSYIISPLHDKESCKPHRHVMLIFANARSSKKVAEFCVSFGAVFGRDVHSPQRFARYLCHLDEFDKPIYDVSLVRSSADISYEDFIASDEDILRDVFFYIRTHQISSVAELIDRTYACPDNKRFLRVLLKRSTESIILDYIRSCYWESTQLTRQELLEHFRGNVGMLETPTSAEFSIFQFSMLETPTSAEFSMLKTPL